jgi:protein-disulfide isomerase-like protein with CxxC motif
MKPSSNKKQLNIFKKELLMNNIEEIINETGEMFGSITLNDVKHW